MSICEREARKKIFTSFFSCLDGLSWHRRALHCTVTAFRVMLRASNSRNRS